VVLDVPGLQPEGVWLTILVNCVLCLIGIVFDDVDALLVSGVPWARVIGGVSSHPSSQFVHILSKRLLLLLREEEERLMDGSPRNGFQVVHVSSCVEAAMSVRGDSFSGGAKPLHEPLLLSL
jgi:hypothetical protein